MGKLEKIAAALPENSAALILTDVNRRYVSGFKSSLGYLFISRAESALYVDSRYFEAAERQVKSLPVRLLTKLSDAMKEFLGDRFESLYLEEEITVADRRQIAKISEIPLADDSLLSDTLHKLRAVKDEDEIAAITKAQRIAEAAFERLLPMIRPGVSERELAIELDYQMRKLGADDLSFETIAVSGENSSMPHGVPGERKIQNGDFITFDFGALKCGYHSDMTRTVAVGHCTDEMREVYDIVKTAGEKCLEILRAGLPCKDADAAARDYIEQAGYGKYFGHGTGHSVGLEIHESPNLSPRSEAVLQSGNIVTVEPGIYLPGKFGVRIEDMARITDDGCVNLTKTPKDLLIL